MTFELTDYQQDAVSQSVARLSYAQQDFRQRDGEQTTVALTAPTGAGKTVIATHVLEQLRFGQEGESGNPELTVLWVTDDPALNRQTRDKMLLSGSEFGEDDLIEIDSSFDDPVLRRGRVHFAHIQLFGSGTSSMRDSDTREHGLWEIIAESVHQYQENLLLVIDEAHKGTEGTAAGKATIIERLSHGGDASHFSGHAQPATPVIYGITATPERFFQGMKRHSRTTRAVRVPAAEVRESGLLKDQIIVRHPGDRQPAESTLIGQAVQSLKASDAAWKRHAEATGEPRVEPLLVLQVEAGISDSRVAEILNTLESEWDILQGDAVAHSFDTHAPVKISGGRELRYIAPDRIDQDRRVRAVLFKQALTTGWDCPRAEVMLSLRSAKDPTSIAQLMGRMVRTPLARRIDTDESLNAVTLYLPLYDSHEVARVVASLDSSEFGAEVAVSVEPVACVPALPDEHPVWDALRALPTVQRRSRSWRSETERLLQLAQLLNQPTENRRAIELRAGRRARNHLISAVARERQNHRETLAELEEEVRTLDLSASVFDRGEDGAFSRAVQDPGARVQASAIDVKRQFDHAKKILPDGIAEWFFDHRAEEVEEHGGIVDEQQLYSEIAALTKTEDMAQIIVRAVEQAAAGLFAEWQREYTNTVAKELPRAQQRAFEEIWSDDDGVISTTLHPPESYSASTKVIRGSGDQAVSESLPTYAGHLYQAPEDHPLAERFPAKLTSWEDRVLEKETQRANLVSWYRNPSRSQHGLAVPYRHGGQTELLYPDFLFFYDVGGEIQLDVVEPHRHVQADTGPKWAGLARWAQQNSQVVRGAQAVIVLREDLMALDLSIPGIEEDLDASTGEQDIERLFQERGSRY